METNSSSVELANERFTGVKTDHYFSAFPSRSYIIQTIACIYLCYIKTATGWKEEVEKVLKFYLFRKLTVSETNIPGL